MKNKYCTQLTKFPKRGDCHLIDGDDIYLCKITRLPCVARELNWDHRYDSDDRAVFYERDLVINEERLATCPAWNPSEVLAKKLRNEIARTKIAAFKKQVEK